MRSSQLATQKAFGDRGQFGELPKPGNTAVSLAGTEPTRPGLDCDACGSEGDAVKRSNGLTLCDMCFDDETCRSCYEPLDDGEGSNGYCGNCADARSCSECGEEIAEDLEDVQGDHLCDSCREEAADDDTQFVCGWCGQLCYESGRDVRTGSIRCDDLDPKHRLHAPAEDDAPLTTRA